MEGIFHFSRHPCMSRAHSSERDSRSKSINWDAAFYIYTFSVRAMKWTLVCVFLCKCFLAIQCCTSFIHLSGIFQYANGNPNETCRVAKQLGFCVLLLWFLLSLCQIFFFFLSNVGVPLVCKKVNWIILICRYCSRTDDCNRQRWTWNTAYKVEVQNCGPGSSTY